MITTERPGQPAVPGIDEPTIELHIMPAPEAAQRLVHLAHLLEDIATGMGGQPFTFTEFDLATRRAAAAQEVLSVAIAWRNRQQSSSSQPDDYHGMLVAAVDRWLALGGTSLRGGPTPASEGAHRADGGPKPDAGITPVPGVDRLLDQVDEQINVASFAAGNVRMVGRATIHQILQAIRYAGCVPADDDARAGIARAALGSATAEDRAKVARVVDALTAAGAPTA